MHEDTLRREIDSLREHLHSVRAAGRKGDLEGVNRHVEKADAALSRVCTVLSFALPKNDA